MFPQNEMYSNFLAKTYAKSGNYKEAINAYTKIINNQPPSDDNKLTFTKRAEAFYKLGDYKSALADLAKVENFHPKEKRKDGGFSSLTTPEFYLLKGRINLASGNFAAAVKDSSKAIEFNLVDLYGYGIEEPYIKPLAIESFQLRAEANCKLGKKQEAKTDEKEAISLGGKVETPCK